MRLYGPLLSPCQRRTSFLQFSKQWSKHPRSPANFAVCISHSCRLLHGAPQVLSIWSLMCFSEDQCWLKHFSTVKLRIEVDTSWVRLRKRGSLVLRDRRFSLWYRRRCHSAGRGRGRDDLRVIVALRRTRVWIRRPKPWRQPHRVAQSAATISEEDNCFGDGGTSCPLGGDVA